MIKVYGIKNCDNVKKALSFFKNNAIDYEFIDFKSDPATCEHISKWLKHVEMKKLFNSRSTTYRTLKLKELNLDDDVKKKWLCRENMLIKRPVIEFDDKVIVGFNDKEYKELFL
jgi:Spx/MgsR family transcriptional regulator